MIELDSSSLAPGVGPLHRVTTPAGREEQGTSLSLLILFIHRPTPCTPCGQCQRGHFRRLLQTGIAGSGLLWASQLDPQPAWPGPGRGGHCGGPWGLAGYENGDK